MNLDFLDFKPELPERGSFIAGTTLQIVWDSTSLSALCRCPREYYYNIVCGITPLAESVHLKFGIVYHAALERYDYAKCGNETAPPMSHDEAQLEAVKYALTATWEPRHNRGWVSDHETKNRFSLVQTVVDYLDHFTGENEALTTVRMPNGDPAVELSYSIPTQYRAPNGEFYRYNGHLDRLAEMHGMRYISDRKTTSMPLNDAYYSQYEPNVQMGGYDWAGQILFDKPINGIIIDGVQITSKGGYIHTQFNRKIINRTPAGRDEWYRDLGVYIALAESYSRQNYWPMNRTACVRGFMKCSYHAICKEGPEVRKNWTKGVYGVKYWDPAKYRSAEVV